MADFTKFGGTTPRVVIYKSESHKLHQAFLVENPVKKIYAGNPVAITTNGKIELLTNANKANYLGIAVTDSNNPAYKESAKVDSVEVTVAVQGFMIINAIAEDILNAGPVEIGTGMDATNHFTKFKTFSQAEAEAAPVNFISLTKASVEGELIQVLCK